MIRLLTEGEREEAQRLATTERCGGFYPSSDIVGALTDEGEVIAGLGVETCFFLGPIIVRREWRGKQVPGQLVDYARRGMEGHRVLLFTENEFVKRLADEYGMYRPRGEFYMAVAGR